MENKNRFQKERKREIARNRPAHAKMYSLPRWRKLRLVMLKENPQCAVCGHPATDVDHKIDHKGNYGLFYSKDNLQCLCKSCHSRKTAIAYGFGNGGQDKMVGRCNADGMPVDPRHPWNN